MRVLHVHKFFHPHAGSETVFLHTRRLLSDHGHEVIDFAMAHPANLSSPYDEFFAPQRDYTDPARGRARRARDALASVYSFSARARLRSLIALRRPDVAHLHLVYHQLTMSIVDELHRARIPIAMTLHDYKIACPAYTLYRDGRPCRDCAGGAFHNAMRYRCVKGSRVASTLGAAESMLAHRGGKYAKLDAVICPSAFVRRVACDAGAPPARTHVIANFLPDDEVTRPVTDLADAPRFLFAGRLEEVKGISDLLAAFLAGGSAMGTLAIAGAGGHVEQAVTEAARSARNIEYLGRLTREEVLAELSRSRAAVLPARWEENNPMSILEARTRGIPVIVSDRGGLPEMVTDGVDGRVVPAGQPARLREAVLELAGDRERARQMGLRGYERFRHDNNAAAHYGALMAAYRAAGEHRRRRTRVSARSAGPSV